MSKEQNIQNKKLFKAYSRYTYCHKYNNREIDKIVFPLRRKHQNKLRKLKMRNYRDWHYRRAWPEKIICIIEAKYGRK